MADEQIVTNIVAKSDFSNLITDLNKVSSALTVLQDKLIASNKMLASQVAVMNRSFAETLRSTGQFSTHFVSLSSDVDKFGSQLDKGQLKLNQFFKTYSNHIKSNGGLIRDLARQQVQMQNAVLQPLGRNAEGLMQYNVHIPRGLDIVKNKTAIAKQELMIMNKVIQEGAGQLINWGKNTQWAGRQLTVGLTLPLAAFGKASADAFRTADAELTRLTKVYGGIAATSSQELGKVRADVSKTAAELSKSYGSSFTDTIALAADIAATGKTGNELLGSIKETTRLAVLGEVDRQDAMKATLAIQTAFKQNTEELAGSINFLNAVENQTSTTLNDLVEAIPKAGPIIKGLGGSVQDLALYLTAMREGGISAAEGANALKSGLASLINPTKVAQGMFNGFGISLKSIVENNAGNVTATILELQAALDKLDPLQKQRALEQLFGKFQFARMNALFENLGRQGSQTLQVLDLMKASSTDLANIAGRELSQVTESASGKYKRAVEGLKADLAGIGDQFLKINTTLINVVDKVLKFTQSLPGPVKTVLGFVGMLTAAAGPLIMLTGVLGNFFGYIIKGVSHMRAFFKGGEGWKLLTPEILAADKAGDLIEKTFYSDAKAAAILKQAISGLSAEFTRLEATANNAAIAVNPTVATTAGSTIIAGTADRVANPQHPLIGEQGTRAAAHHNPRSGMSERERLNQTIHAFTPAPIPLNQKIGAVPQIFAQGDLPNIPGLTTSGGVSTGIVAGEAAKWHALMGTLSMMTKEEVAALKLEIARTGTFSSEINQTFSQLLPAMNNLTSNAATQSAAIVAELQAGKLTVDAARAKIIALNAQLETAMGQATTQLATDLGRTVNLTQVPLIDQPIVGKTGKANIKELFRQKRPAAGIINRIASALGVKTWGGGYSTETTIPKRFNTGGSVGGIGSTDTVPAMLTPGEFVINAKATREHLPLLEAINGGMGSGGPGFQEGGFLPSTMLWQGSKMNAILAHPDQMGRRKKLDLPPGDTIPGKLFADDFLQMRRKGMHPGGLLYEIGTQLGYDKRDLQFAINPMEKEIRTTLARAGNITPRQYDEIVSNIIYRHIGKVSRQSAAKGRRVSFLEEIATLGFKRNEKNKSILKGSIQNIGFDGQKVPQPFVSTGGGIPADSMAGPHFAKMQELYPESQRTPTPEFGKGRTLKSLFDAERGHVGASLPMGGLPFNTAVRGIHPTNYSINAHARTDKNKLTWLGMPLRKLPRGWANPRYVAPDPRSEALRAKWRAGYATGGLVTGGGRRPLGFVTGGQVPSMGTAMTAGFGLQMAGSMVGGQTGNIMMLGGLAAQLAPMMASLVQSISKAGVATTSFRELFAKAATGISAGIRMIGSALKFLFLNPIGLTITAVTALTVIFFKLKQRATEAGKANRLAFGGDKESFASVGITQYKSLTDRLKEVNDQMELNKAKALSLYNQYTKGGPTGITLTIKELNDAIANATKNQKAYVDAFNNIKSDRVVKYASDLKAQFLALGMSAKDASNQIYAIIKASDKSAQALSAVSSVDFTNLKDQTSAIKYVLDNLSKATGKTFNAEEFAKGLDTLTNSILMYRDSLLSATDKKTGQNINDEATALKLTMEEISKIKSSNAKLDTDQLTALKKQNMAYNGILGSAETLQSVTAKILMYTAGLGDIVDFSRMSADAAVAMANNYSQVESGMKSIFENTSAGKAMAGAIKAGQNNAATLAATIKKAQAMDADYYKNKIALIDKAIQKIRDEANARIQALQDQANAEDTRLNIQKKQLEYQDKLAAGDMAGAAQAQIDLQLLLKQKQAEDAISAIKKKADEDEAKKNAEKEEWQRRQDAFNKGLQVSQAQSAETTANVAQLQSFESRITGFMAKIGATKDTGKKDELTKQLAALLDEIRTSGNKEAIKFYQSLASEYGIGDSRYSDIKSPLNIAKNYASGFAKDASAFAKNPDNLTFKTAVEAFSAAVNKFSGSQFGTKDSPYTVKAGTKISRFGADKDIGAAGSSWSGFGINSDREAIKDYANQKGYKPGTYFETNGGQGKKNLFYVGEDGNITRMKANYATGGYISGAGTGTSDSIPAMLSNGEYVINAASVQAIGTPTLDKINKMATGGFVSYNVPKANSYPMGYNRGGMIQHYNVGGLVINTQPGQNEMEIARMAVSLMDARNRVSSISQGRNINA